MIESISDIIKHKNLAPTSRNMHDQVSCIYIGRHSAVVVFHRSGLRRDVWCQGRLLHEAVDAAFSMRAR
jgi:hypothetical protein